ncbi:MAG: glycosyltransferase family 4 [Treponematales bacterium]
MKNGSPRVLHLVGGELSGGAARGAYWLHRGLRNIGIESMILTNGAPKADDESVVSVLTTPREKLLRKARFAREWMRLARYKKRTGGVFSSGFEGLDFTKTSEYKNADIVHLHWVCGGLMKLKDLRKVNKPIVWTLRDMWPMTGGCHYPMACEKYKTGCGACPQLGSARKGDLSRRVFERKRTAISCGIHFVGISNWISEAARESALLGRADITTIFNCIDTDEFFPVGKTSAREALGLFTEKHIVLFGAQFTSDFYKGFDKLMSALKHLDPSRYFLCGFGNPSHSFVKEIGSLGFEYKDFGFLRDTVSLRLAYSAARVFAAPSAQEAFGKTLAEALACGTPVVCFDATGPRDIVSHKIDGYSAKPFSAEDFAAGIEWAACHADYAALCRAARESAVAKFSIDLIAGQYAELYERITRAGAHRKS